MQRLAGFPTGLLSLLGSQSFGTAPKELADVISPVVSADELYLLTAQEPEVLIIAAPAAGINAGIRVPQGEVWRVNGGGLFLATGAGVTVGGVTLVLESQGGLVPLADTVLNVPASTTILVASKQVPIWVKAGDQVTAYLQGLVGVPTVSIALVISRLKA